MVATLTSTVDGGKAPSAMDGGVALRRILLNAPRQPPITATMMASSSTKKKRNLFPQPPLNGNDK
ncbi:hypothetical protein GYH30_015921 [Glycine max]|nr:hypothetical protein GYH30_015921 [Glycine max]